MKAVYCTREKASHNYSGQDWLSYGRGQIRKLRIASLFASAGFAYGQG
jgi:hypothetical protein